MLLIQDENTLRTYLPNAFTTVEGESSLFDKLMPWLKTAELWLQQKILGTPTLNAIAVEEDSTANNLARKVVTATAFKSAIPSLDLVLTPNGFGIVSNQNVAPASKERVERLIKELDESRDNDIEALLSLLPNREDWHDSLPYRFWSATLFPNIDVCREVKQPRNDMRSRYDHFLRLRSHIINIEEQMAEEFLSHELLDHLRHQLANAPSEMTQSEQRVLKQVRSEIVSILNGFPPSREHLVSIVNFIRHNPDDFVSWHTSATAQLFTPPIFENKKKSSGYWF